MRDLLADHLRAATQYAAARLDSGQFAYVATLFDALIQIGGPVPLGRDPAVPTVPAVACPGTNLLSRHKRTESVLLDMRENGRQWHEVEWLAINNLLLGMRSQPFFAKTLQELNITHTFEIWDVSPAPAGQGTGGSYATGTPLKTPSGFPELVLYYLQDHAGGQGGILAPGPRTICYRRAVAPSEPDGPFRSHGYQSDRLALAYLAAWNDMPSADIFSPTHVLKWTVDPGRAEGNAAAVAEAIDKDLDAQVAAIQAFLVKAKQSGAPDLRGTRLRIAVQILDRRRTWHDALPPVKDREFAVE